VRASYSAVGLVLILTAHLLPRPCSGAERVSFGTDWKAQAEHGGFYQAIARGFYTRRGLEVTLRQGGPQVNHAQLLAAGRLDFNMASTSFIPLNFARENIPMLAVAAIFQKDPQVLIAHAGQGHDSLASLKGKAILIGTDTRVGSWLFLKARFGYGDEQIRPYTFSVAPFLMNPQAVQQGYLTSEPFLIEQAGVKAVVHLLADAGYEGYAALIQTSRRNVERRPDLVQRFVDASIEGWADYLHGDPAAAHALIKRDNPEMTDELLAYGRGKLKEFGIVESGDALEHGIGAMSAERWRRFFELMADQGLYPRDLDYEEAYTLRFVNKRHGLERVAGAMRARSRSRRSSSLPLRGEAGWGVDE
jgi:NitT/TauT family transport system substrate-binding protein